MFYISLQYTKVKKPEWSRDQLKRKDSESEDKKEDEEDHQGAEEEEEED